MDQAALRHLFDYTDFTWASYERTLDTLPEGALTRPIDTAGRQTLGHGLFHLASAWDGWLREHASSAHGIPELDDEAARRHWSTIQQYRVATRAVMRQILETATDDVLQAVTEDLWPDEEGHPRFHASPGEVLAHILLHERGHHGDITTMLTALGADPPASDYLIYLFFQRREK